MDIKVGKYFIRSDKYCCWIDEERKSVKGKEYCENVCGWYMDFKSLLDGFASRKLRSEDVPDVKTALKVIVEAENELKEFANKLGTAIDIKVEEHLADELPTKPKRKRNGTK